MIVGVPREIKPGEQRVALTPAGVPLLWPWKRRFGLPLCATGGAAELVAVAAILVGAAWIATGGSR